MLLATVAAIWSRYRTVAPLLQTPGSTSLHSNLAAPYTYLLDVCGKPLRDATGVRVCLVSPVKGASLLVTETGDAVQVTGESVASGVRALPGLELSLAGDVLVDGSGNKLLGEFGAVMRVSRSDTGADWATSSSPLMTRCCGHWCPCPVDSLLQCILPCPALLALATPRGLQRRNWLCHFMVTPCVTPQVLLDPNGMPRTSPCALPLACTRAGDLVFGPGDTLLYLAPDGHSLVSGDGRPLLGPKGELMQLGPRGELVTVFGRPAQQVLRENSDQHMVRVPGGSVGVSGEWQTLQTKKLAAEPLC